MEPIETKITQVDAAGKFSVVFTRPIELKIGYINSQIKNTKSANERKLQQQSDYLSDDQIKVLAK